MDTDEDPLARRLFGPTGWTDTLVELLEGYMLGDAAFGVREFAGVPLAVARQVADALEAAGVDGIEGPSGREVVDVAEVFGPTATIAGRAVDRSRGDERVEFTTAQVDVTGWKERMVQSVLDRQLRAGRRCELDASGEHRRLAVYW